LLKHCWMWIRCAPRQLLQGHLSDSELRQRRALLAMTMMKLKSALAALMTNYRLLKMESLLKVSLGSSR
jgi:hypothetical protein